ncbi:MAG TPA: MBL fold metallo-hydrolase [Clostridia bacterium]|nr:MBL fold metallo-hydrolase [Clostridia bacterium]
MHRTTLGDFELILISDGGYYLDGGSMFGVVPKPMWEKKFAPDQFNRLRLGLNTLVVRTGKHTVLVETGIGNKLPDKLLRIYENEARLLNALEEAKIAPDEIDVVINTHLHFDHCGWNTFLRGGKVVATFPKAKYYAQEGELRHANMQHERDRISYISDNYNPLVENGQMQLLRGDQEIVPGVSVRVFPGHTRNHQAVIFKSGGHTACYIGDLIPTAAHLHPTWVMAYDLFPLETIESRHRYYDDALPQRWLTIFTHDPKIPWAFVGADEQGRLAAKPVREAVTA